VVQITLFVSQGTDLPLRNRTPGDFAVSSDFHVAAAFLAGSGKEAVTLRAYSQSLFVKLIRRSILFGQHGSGTLYHLIYVSHLGDIADKA
jgi:hypothetical protein